MGGIRQRSRSTQGVSIVIPVFNKIELTRSCLEAIRKTAPDCAVVVVDNASSDGTASFLGTQTWLETITNTENLGFARACNQGARAADGDILVLLNNDTEPQPGWLEPLVAGLAHEGVGIVGSKLLYPDRTIQHAGVVFTPSDRYPFAPNHLYKGCPETAEFVNRDRDFRAVTAACMALRRDLYFELGGLDDGFVNGFEDVDLCLRAGAAGHRIRYVPASVVIHHESKSPGRHDHEEENLARLMERWGHAVEPDLLGYLEEDRLRLHFRNQVLHFRDPTDSFDFKVDGNLPNPLPAEMVEEDLLGHYIPDIVNRLRFRVEARPARQEMADANADVAVIEAPIHARNQAAAEAKSEWLAFLSPGAKPEAGWLAALVEAVRREPDVGIIGPKVVDTQRRIRHAGLVFAVRSGEKVLVASKEHWVAERTQARLPYPLYRGFPDTAPFVNERREFQAVSGSCMWVDRARFLGAGGYDATLPEGLQDVDLCLRVLKCGKRIIYCPNAVIVEESDPIAMPTGLDPADARRLLERWGHFILGDDETYLDHDSFLPVSGQADKSFYVWSAQMALADAALQSGRLEDAWNLLCDVLEARPAFEPARILRALLEVRFRKLAGTTSSVPALSLT